MTNSIIIGSYVEAPCLLVICRSVVVSFVDDDVCLETCFCRLHSIIRRSSCLGEEPVIYAVGFSVAVLLLLSNPRSGAFFAAFLNVPLMDKGGARGSQGGVISRPIG